MSSPAGQAEVTAESLRRDPEHGFLRLHKLAEKASQDPQAASVLANLSPALTHLDASRLAGIAEGLHHLLQSRFTPELLSVGLRGLIHHLEKPDHETLQGAAEALEVYSLCQRMLDTVTVDQISCLSIYPSSANRNEAPSPMADLGDFLVGFQPVVVALQGYRRVNTPAGGSEYLLQAFQLLESDALQMKLRLASAERILAERITENWRTCIAEEWRHAQGMAKLETELVTKQAIAADDVTLLMNVTNLGLGTASKVSVELMPADKCEIAEGRKAVNEVAPGESVRLQFVVRPKEANHLTLSFRIQYDDRWRAGQSEVVSAVVHLISVPEFRSFNNPYVPGAPLRDKSSVFYGRSDLFAFIQETLGRKRNGRALVLTGERRMGKTSLLKQLPSRLEQDFVTVYLDGQSLAVDPGLPSFFYDLALQISEVAGLEPPRPEDFYEHPATSFERDFLPKVFSVTGERDLLLLLDEFEELQLRVASGKLDPDIFSYLRHLMQHMERLAFIFVGTHRIEELDPHYWSGLFNVALHRRIGLLGEREAKDLITQPVAEYLVYDEGALQRMLRNTAGNPYFLQLLCYEVVRQANRERRAYVSLDSVNSGLTRVIELGQSQFVFMWNQMTAEEQCVLRTSASLVSATTELTLENLAAELRSVGKGSLAERLPNILSDLVHREILNSRGKAPAVYRFALDLTRLWIMDCAEHHLAVSP